jgi:hypothetical protein
MISISLRTMVVLVAGVCAACAALPLPRATSHLAARAHQATPSRIYTLPMGYTMPSSFIGSRSGQGVWFLSSTDATSTIFFVSPDKSEDRSWSLGAHYPLGADSGIAVAPDGSVWAGVGMVLIHLVPATGSVITLHVPNPVESSMAASYEPNFVKGSHDIVALAVSSSGVVAVALSASSQVVVLSGTIFSAWDLPPNTTPRDVAYLSDDTLGVTVNDFVTHKADRIATFTTAGRRTDSPSVSAWDLASTGTSFLTLAGTVATVDAEARVTHSVPMAAPKRSATDTPTPVIQGPVSILPDGDVLVPSSDGVMAVNASNGQAKDGPLPFSSCSSINVVFPPGFTPRASSSTQSCPDTPLMVVTDAAGDIWAQLSSSPNSIALINGAGF